ncbi:MAG: polysaccharide biosynthesis/export family protein [Armatimonadetes bacterium]|nr:polysaccharide biosynthesis/export family protein [Armatimonadota bacterium]
MRRVFVSVLLLAVAVGAAFAQQAAPRKIAPKDVLKLTCAEEELLNKEYKVTKDGVILMDFLGAVEVSGLTDTEAAELVSKKLTQERIVRTATVKVEFKNAAPAEGVPTKSPENKPTEPDKKPAETEKKPADDGKAQDPPQTVLPSAERPIRLSGEFKTCGERPYQSGTTVSALVNEVGANEGADVSKIVVKSTDGSTRFVDATKPEPGIALKPGDEIILVSTNGPAKEVYVLGSVAKPGTVKHRPGMTAKAAIEAAGGFAGAGEKKRVSIERNGQIVQTLDETKANADLVIQPEDRVLVETGESRAYIKVDGAVKSPGYFVATPGMKLSEAVAAAGGFAAKAKTKKVQVTSNGGKARTIDFDEIEQGYMGDVLLQPGDQVVVPGQKRKDDTLLKLGGGLAAFWLLFGR